MTIDELAQLGADERAQRDAFSHHVLVCTAASCLSSCADEVKNALATQINKSVHEKQCRITGAGCMGLCVEGPLVRVQQNQQSALFSHVSPDDLTAIVEALNGDLPPAAMQADASPFFTKQTKVVLENSGAIDPERIEDYLAADGYAALLKALTEMSPTQVIEQVTHSGLRGRGGAGYPTGLKWNTVAKARGENKVVICNADEGDPGAFMDRSVLESDPHRVLEGMAIAAYAVGAAQGFVYVRAEYPLAVERLKTAIRQATRRGLLGLQIGGVAFDFSVELRLGGGAFVCGEETALIASIEGGRGTPRPRPPYPAQEGLWGAPTLINNVETFANIPAIVQRGGDWLAGIGSEKSKGTKVFALAGRVNRTGLVEVPMGMTLREIVFDIGGGISEGRRLKAVQTGGPSGGCIPEQFLDMPVDYESLASVGSIMGSGGMIVMDETSCIVDVAKYFMEFCKSESCGKCIPCRVGTAQIYDLLCNVSRGAATLNDLALLEDLCDVVKHTSLCGLGQAAPNPVFSTLRYFRDEYVAHIVEKRCPAGVCKIGAKAAI